MSSEFTRNLLVELQNDFTVAILHGIYLFIKMAFDMAVVSQVHCMCVWNMLKYITFIRKFRLFKIFTNFLKIYALSVCFEFVHSVICAKQCILINTICLATKGKT